MRTVKEHARRRAPVKARRKINPAGREAGAVSAQSLAPRRGRISAARRTSGAARRRVGAVRMAKALQNQIR